MLVPSSRRGPRRDPAVATRSPEGGGQPDPLMQDACRSPASIFHYTEGARRLERVFNIFLGRVGRSLGERPDGRM